MGWIRVWFRARVSSRAWLVPGFCLHCSCLRRPSFAQGLPVPATPFRQQLQVWPATPAAPLSLLAAMPHLASPRLTSHVSPAVTSCDVAPLTDDRRRPLSLSLSLRQDLGFRGWWGAGRTKKTKGRDGGSGWGRWNEDLDEDPPFCF